MIASRLLLLALAFALGTAFAAAAEFKPRRGLSLDIWQTWPDESRWDDPALLLPYPEWRRTLSEADLAALKAAGLDFLRLPVDPAPLLSGKTAAYRGDLLAGVAAATRTVNAAGLKALVDLHAIPSADRSVDTGRILDDETVFARYVALVEAVAARLSGEDPQRVALELMNEPVTGCEGGDARRWSTHLRRLHEAARAAAPKLTLVLSGACWGSAEGLAALDPAGFADDNLLWSFHSYEPFLLTHQGAGWAGDFIPYVTGLPYPLHGATRADLETAVERIRERIRAEAPLHRRAGLLAYLDEQLAALDTAAELESAMAAPFEHVTAWARAHGVPPQAILLGEFGMIRRAWGADATVPANQRAAFYRDTIALAEKHGFAWSMWSYGSDFGVVDEFEGRKAEPDLIDMVRKLSPL